MTTIRKNPINMSGFANMGEPKINKRYDDTPVENVAEAMGKTVDELTASQNPNRVTFEKKAQVLFDDPLPDPNVPPVSTEEPPSEEASAAEKRAARRAEWKEAEKIRARALQMERDAKAKLAQAQRFEEIAKKAQENPVEVAKALGMAPEEFLRKYQNQMFNIKDEEPKLSPEEEVKQRLSRYEEERQREREEYESLKTQTIKQNYISSKIMPVITGDKDRFELLNLNGIESCASFIYDMMNNYYMQTGEELNPADVAEEMENQLTQEFESRIASTRKLKKFSKHFRTDTDAPGEEVTLPDQLGTEDNGIQKRTSAQDNQANGPAQLGSGPNTLTDTARSQGPASRRPVMPVSNPLNSLPEAAANSYQRQASWDRKRESRLDKLAKGIKT